MSDNKTKECERCGGVMRVYENNKSRITFKCDKCKREEPHPKPQANRLF